MSRYHRVIPSAFAILIAGASGATAQDASELIVRLNRVEGQMRQMSGQIEQLQFDNRTLKDQLRKFQEDVDFRFQEKSGGARASSPPATSTPATRPGKRSDAFDPGAEPEAPGAPRQLGSSGRDPIGAKLAEEPLDLGSAGGRQTTAALPPGASGLNPAMAGGTAAPAAAGGARGEYDAAYASYQQHAYPEAESGFRRFIAAHPRDRLTGDAAYWLGETYLQSKRPREAAEQFLKVSTEHGTSARAPDAMLKLGIALNSLGAKDQACATFAQLERKYPSASAAVRAGTDREQKRARCPT